MWKSFDNGCTIFHFHIFTGMDSSIFTDKAKAPATDDLKKALGSLYSSWAGLVDFVIQRHPVAVEEWNYSKSGWNCRIKDKKRALVYLMPGSKQFRVSFVLGEKATQKVLAADISAELKNIIEASPVYAEGRGIRILVSNKNTMADIEKLAEIKLSS